MMKPVMIGQLACETLTKVTTVRFYESIGLLRPPPRTASGRRTYDASDIERLHFIRNGRRLGFSVDEIRSLMGLAENPDQDCGAASAIATQHLKDVEARLAQLAVLRDELAMLSQSCTKARMADCRIMRAIGRRHPQPERQ
ncbi:helix-turn-helix domain-containing protein [Tardiphaga sp.]|jgi:DNA-binding transcriptional MerR regulator|uniref:MerR family transcriptional regulator n=1 Tax=Tardiphaga sp. TaxID=1926292 RepID=UPI00352BBC01